ncbi:unnamed protein product, partial [Mesorhabditis spiculigera]
MNTPKKAPDDRPVVCQFVHNKLKNYEQIGLFQIQNANRQSELVVENSDAKKVQLIGGVASAAAGYDYVLAKVDKNTGETVYSDVDLYNFTAEYCDDLDMRLGRKRKSMVNYVENKVPTTSMAEAKLSLAMSFGDSKRTRFIEKSDKRLLQETAHKDMQLATFASAPSVDKVKKEEITTEGVLSAINNDVSGALPVAVKEAALPKDVYPMSLFIGDETITLFVPDAKVLMAKAKDDFETTVFGRPFNKFPSPFHNCLSGAIKDERRNTLTYVCAAMLFVAKTARARSTITEQIYTMSAFQPIMVDWVTNRYFSGQRKYKFMKKMAAVEQWTLMVGKLEIDRLMAHTLAMALVIDPENKIYSKDWAEYTKIPITDLQRTLEALGAKKELTPANLQISKGKFVHVLRGPPMPANARRFARRSK